jgi:hypothetical protein
MNWNRTDYGVLIAVCLSLVDGLMTLPFWHLEANPVVLQLGPWGMMAVKIAAGGALAAVWFSSVRNSPYHTLGAWFVWSLSILYAVVVLTNLAVLAIV